MTDHHQPVSITAEEYQEAYHSYSLQSLARACISIALLDQRLAKLSSALLKREPAIRRGELHHWLRLRGWRLPLLSNPPKSTSLQVADTDQASSAQDRWHRVMAAH